MTIERDPPFHWDVTCDECGALLEPRPDTVDYPSFQAVVDRIKAEGWRIDKVAGDWIHTCPDCQENGHAA